MLHEVTASRLILRSLVAFSQTEAIFPKIPRSLIVLIMAHIGLGSTGCVGYMGLYG